MARNGGVAAPDPALEAKRAILYLQALQRARTAPEGTLSAGTLARLHKGPGGLGIGGTHAVDARAMQDSDVSVLMSGLANLRKRLGSQNQGIYAQPF